MAGIKWSVALICPQCREKSVYVDGENLVCIFCDWIRKRLRIFRGVR